MCILKKHADSRLTHAKPSFFYKAKETWFNSKMQTVQMVKKRKKMFYRKQKKA